MTTTATTPEQRLRTMAEYHVERAREWRRKASGYVGPAKAANVGAYTFNADHQDADAVACLAGADALAEREALRAELAQLADFNPDWDMLAATRDSLREHMAEIKALRARVARLEQTIRWALGEAGEFPEEPPPIAGTYRQRYHWRTQLRQMAALTPEEPSR